MVDIIIASAVEMLNSISAVYRTSPCISNGIELSKDVDDYRDLVIRKQKQGILLDPNQPWVKEGRDTRYGLQTVYGYIREWVVGYSTSVCTFNTKTKPSCIEFPQDIPTQTLGVDLYHLVDGWKTPASASCKSGTKATGSNKIDLYSGWLYLNGEFRTRVVRLCITTEDHHTPSHFAFNVRTIDMAMIRHMIEDEVIVFTEEEIKDGHAIATITQAQIDKYTKRYGYCDSYVPVRIPRIKYEQV